MRTGMPLGLGGRLQEVGSFLHFPGVSAAFALVSISFAVTAQAKPLL